jgi:outer membrane protein TolC
MKHASRSLTPVYSVIIVVAFAGNLVKAATVPLKQAVELALAHSSTSVEAAANEQKAFAIYQESRNQYLPQLTVGSGLGASWGFPLSLEGSAPSILNVNAQSALFNPALRDFVRAAKNESDASLFQAKDQREQVMQDTVLTYAELVKWEGMAPQLRQSLAEAEKSASLIQQRITAGVDSQIEAERAKLDSAQARLRVAQADGAIDVLRGHLSQLTGLPAASIDTDPDSIPALPKINQEENLAKDAEESSPAVQTAVIRARAQYFQAQGEHRAKWPSVDFAAQYALLSTYNNYFEYYKAFQRNNATVGVSIRFPFLDFSQRARAQAADADLFLAKKNVEDVKAQVSEQTLKLQRSVEQLSAAQQVADAEYQLAQSDLQSVQVRMNNGTANIHDLESARTQVNEDYYALQGANFDLERSRIALLRATGQLEDWLGIPR